MTSEQQRLLLISYAFPPTGGGGVQRSVKFSKYLPEHGWYPTVLTAANPSVPVHDTDLPDDIDPATTTILRARTLEPGYAFKQRLITASNRNAVTPGPVPRGGIARSLKDSARGLVRRVGMSLLQPDPQTLWNPLAFRTALAALRQTRHDAIYVSGPPFSSFLLATALKTRVGLPLVVDFRDEWLLASQYLENHQRRGIAYRRQLRMLNKVVRAADAIIATTEASAVELSRYAQLANSAATSTCIYNGYDEDDIAAVQWSDQKSNRLRIVYAGTLWRLTDITPMVAALKRLASADRRVAAGIELVVAGRRTPEQDAILAQLDSTPIVMERYDYLPHRRCLQLAASADVLLLLLADLPGAERVVPAKLFEYLALSEAAGSTSVPPDSALDPAPSRRRPILAICGQGETAQLLHGHDQPNAFLPDQTEQIANWLAAQVRLRRAPATPAASADSRIRRYSRRDLTGQLADVLQGALRGSRASDRRISC